MTSRQMNPGQRPRENTSVGIAFFLLGLWLAAALTGCREASLAAAPTVILATTTPTRTPVSRLTASPTATRTRIATQTPEPTPAATQTAPPPTSTIAPTPTIAPTSKPLPSLLVQILDADSGEPVSGAEVWLADVTIAQVSDAKGHTLFTNLGEGTYILRVSAEGYLEGNVEVAIGAGESQQRVNLIARVFARVTTASGNLRSGPGTVYARRGSVQEGDLLEVIGVSEDGEWLVVATGGDTSAWMWSGLCTIEGTLDRAEVATAPPTPVPVPTSTPVPTPTPSHPQPGIYTFDNACITYFAVDNDPTTVKWCVESVEIPEQGHMLFIVAWHVDTRQSHVGSVTKMPDEGKTAMYLIDNVGNRYDFVAVGGAARDMTKVGFPGKTLRGEFWFPLPKPGAFLFTFYDDDQCAREQPCIIENILLGTTTQ